VGAWTGYLYRRDPERPAGNYLPQEVANNAKKFKPRITGFFDKREQKTKIFYQESRKQGMQEGQVGDGNQTEKWRQKDEAGDSLAREDAKKE